MHDAQVRTDGSRIRWVEIPGSGPARVYLHGLGASSAPYYAEAVSHPALAGRRSLLMDLLGFGISDRPADAGYSMPEHADYLAAALTEADVHDAEVVAHSMGGMIAVHLAARHPRLVAKLVLVDATLDPTPTTSGILRYTEEEFVDHGRQEILDHISPSWAATMRLVGPEALYRSAAGMAHVGQDHPSARELLRKLTIPRTHLVQAASEEPAEPGVRLVVMPGCGHNIMLDDPEGFAVATAAAFAE
jgi:pimeloyl-ACP methyl ester carboxylesterase